METIMALSSRINGLVWGIPMLVLMVGCGIFMSSRLGFVQFRRFGYTMRNTLGKMFDKTEVEDGALSPVQAMTTALAGTVGTGSIAGVAGAIALGGPGAVFWMWVAALFGMCTKFSEITLAVRYREKNEDGEWIGGPMYYIKNGLGKKWQFLAVLYSILGILTVFGTGNATQVNTIVASIDSALFNFNVFNEDNVGNVNLGIGILIAVLVLLILLGGIKRIGNVTSKLVPFMAVFYIVMGLILVAVNYERVPEVFKSIFEGAFNPRSVTGGVVGSLFISMRRGVSRGIFSNEAGLGTGSIAHASSDVAHPIQQGMWGIFEVFADTIVICTLTALAILCSGININYGKAAGAELTISGFTTTFGGWISILLAVALCCFAFSTILGWGLYGSRCIEYLFGPKVVKPFIIVYALVAIIGATMDLGLLWSLADTFNGLMIIPNLIAVFLLSGTVIHLVKDYFRNPESQRLEMDK